jgi:hypothetical protein
MAAGKIVRKENFNALASVWVTSGHGDLVGLPIEDHLEKEQPHQSQN